MPTADHAAFWRGFLDGHTVTTLPRWAAEPRAGQVRAGIAVPDAATGLARSLSEPVQRVVLAAFVRVIGLLTGEDDVTIGHRSHPDEQFLPLRVRQAGGSWRDLIGAVRAAEQAAAGHRGSPPHPAAPLFDVGFGPDAWAGPAGVALAAECTAGRIPVRCRADLFDAAYAARFVGYLDAALAAMTADPAAHWRQAGLISATERRHLLHERSGPSLTLPDERAHTLFEQQTRRRPDAVAVSWRDQRWSYDRVNRAANQIAHALLAAGLRAEDVVAIATGRHPLWLCAVIGVLKAGGAYLPVEPEFPAARVATLVEQSGCRFLLTEPGGPAQVPGTPGLWSRPVSSLLGAGQPDSDPGVPVEAGQLAYIYFTSGSTGTPKGAMCEQIGMLNHLTAKVRDFAIGPDDVVVQNARQSFDISLWQLIAPLMVGARALIVPSDVILDVRRFAAEMVAGGATILQVVPSYLDVLLRHIEQEGPSAPGLGELRQVCVTGEAIGKPLVDRWFASYPQIALVNAYGATEASDDTTHEVMSASPPGDLVPVGRPIGNVTVYVLGPGDTLRPLGTPGEIAFSGICVGRGYVNDAERTAEVFAADPFRPGERMYRTGDFGRWLPSGSLEFHGRRDEQVKIHGVRIELGEVESRACAHPLVHAAAVITIPLSGTGKELVAFYTSPAGLDPGELRGHLIGALPAAAVPARLFRVDALPLTANGKVDKRRLTSMATQSASPLGGGQRVPPRTATQRRIASAWAQAMNRPVADIGCDDNFFDIGGSSLSALRVVASLNGLISLDDLVRNPVLSALSAAADGTGPRPGGGVLRLLAGPPAGATVAVVCVPAAAGVAISFQPLAAAIAAHDPTMAIYAVQPPGHDLSRRDEPLLELDELAKLLMEELAAVAAPIAVCGHCAGVPLALEAARRLGSRARHVFVAARLLEPHGELAREVAAVSAATDSGLTAELAALGGLDSPAMASLSPADESFIGRVYRHDTRVANQYLIEAPESWQQKLTCPVAVMLGRSDPSTSGQAGRYADWSAFSPEVTFAELDGGHYFPGTHPAQAAEVMVSALSEQA